MYVFLKLFSLRDRVCDRKTILNRSVIVSPLSRGSTNELLNANRLKVLSEEDKWLKAKANPDQQNVRTNTVF